MKSFLDKYDTIIFDMDGVITSEQNYWNSAALVVREYLTSEKYFGNEKINAADMSSNVAKIRSEVFAGDSIINELKSRGVNSNWDLGYVTLCISLITGSSDPESILEYSKGLGANILDEYDKLAQQAADKLGIDSAEASRSGRMWSDMRDCFQEWFLGDKAFSREYGREPVQSGKPGLMHSEKPIIGMDELKRMLRELSESKRVCTGTGRPYIELEAPLKSWDVMKYFAPDGLCNYDHVMEAERKTGMNALTKPHPYMFLKALYGTDYDDFRLINGDYDGLFIKKTIVVGDAGADILAAKAMGADFCAVLTGIAGKSGRRYFEELGAEYILDSAAELI